MKLLNEPKIYNDIRVICGEANAFIRIKNFDLAGMSLVEAFEEVRRLQTPDIIASATQLVAEIYNDHQEDFNKRGYDFERWR